MTMTFDEICDAVLHLPKGDQVRLLSLVALEVADAHPGIDFQANVCGGSARVIRTRIPVWLLESLRRGGRTDAELLAAYPALNSEDLANAWNYARTHREEMDREIAANGDEPMKTQGTGATITLGGILTPPGHRATPSTLWQPPQKRHPHRSSRESPPA